MPELHPNLLQAERTVLVVIDMQEPLLRTIFQPDRVRSRVAMLMEGARILKLPIIATTQYQSRLGKIEAQFASLLPPRLNTIDKLCFSCLDDPTFARELEKSGRSQVLLCGVEAHICVSQTAHALILAGHQVHIAADAISSRSETNWQLGTAKMQQSGAILSSTEMALYEMLRAAGTDNFKDILNIIKKG